MARKRTSHNDPLLMYEHYVNKLKTMKQGYDASASYRFYDFESGFKGLRTVQNTFKQYLNQVLAEIYAQGVTPDDFPVNGTVQLGLIKIFASWYHLSLEQMGGYQIASRLSAIATMSLSELMSATPLTCGELTELVNAVFKRWIGKEPFEGNEEDDICDVTAKELVDPIPLSAPTGIQAPLGEVLKATSPEQIISAKSTTGA